ncbi:thioredoxin family protein [Bacillus timonensis]|nr:thioredoxin family protein [Bacillus timonensis]
MKKLETMEQFKEVSQNSSCVLMFSADWCPDCRIIEPILPKIEAAYSQYTFYYVDRDQFIELCVEMEIFGIPSFVAFQNGQEAGRFVSKDRKTKEEIEAFLNRLS